MPTVQVVAAALTRNGLVLAGRRRTPSGWEFPGGKIEAGETAAAAIVRECREELAVDVRAVVELAVVEDGPITLRLWRVELVAGEPRAGADHDELAWLPTDRLAELDWLPADRALLSSLTG